MTAVAVAEYRSRLPMPVGIEGMDQRLWRVLCETIFPSAKTPEAIVMALDYCRARNLDILKKPVNIVPMWSSSLRREVETVWPGINEIQVTASRTGEWAGMDEPKWGDDVTKTLKGRKRDGSNWVEASATVTYPAWCAVTVYRMVKGVRCAFCEPVYWEEAYSRMGGQQSFLPTDMWAKRPRGQLHKVAKAASLRAAFPEEASLTAEEMEGKEIEAGGVVIDHEPPKALQRPVAAPLKLASPTVAPEHDPVTGESGPRRIEVPTEPDGTRLWRAYGEKVVAGVRSAKNPAEVGQWLRFNDWAFSEMKAAADKLYDRMCKAIDAHLASVTPRLTPNDSKGLLKGLLGKVLKATSEAELNQLIADTTVEYASLLDGDQKQFDQGIGHRRSSLVEEKEGLPGNDDIVGDRHEDENPEE